jgi:DNA repair protein RadD
VSTLNLFEPQVISDVKPTKLRKYQERGIQKLRDRVREGKKRILLVGPTAMGKMVMCASIIRTSSVPVLFVVHRVELINQCIEQLAALGITNVGVMRGDDDRTDPSAATQIASIQTLARRKKPPAGLVIIDECFPAGTQVDGRPIESFRVGDQVNTFDPKNENLCVSRVVRTFCRKPSSLVRLTVSGQTLVCTPNHKLWTRNGWIEAGLSLGHEVMLAPNNLRQMQKGNWKETETHEHRNVLRLLSGEEKRRAETEEEALQNMCSADLSAGKIVLPDTQKPQKPKTRTDKTIDLRLVQKGERQTSSPSQSSVVLRAVQAETEGSETKEGRDAVFRLRHIGYFARPIWARTSSQRTCLLFRKTHARVCRTSSVEEEGFGLQSQTYIRANARTQSDAQPVIPGENVADASKDRTSTEPNRRQRTRAFQTATENVRSPWGRLENGDPDQHEKDLGAPELYSHRHSEQYSQNSDRDRRIVAWSSEGEGIRRAKRSLSASCRVDRVEVFEPSSDGTFGGMCPDGHVYNIEVEGTHTYFANGIAVSNCHRAPSDSYLDVFEFYKNSIILGFTATPTRLDGRPLGSVFEAMEIVITYAELIRDGFVVAPECYGAPAGGPNLTGVKTIGGDYDEGALGEIMRDKSLVGSLLAHWLQLSNMYQKPDKSIGLVEGPRRRTLIFAVNIAHSQDICEKFSAAGVRIAHLDGDTSEDDRRNTIQALGDGLIDAISSCNILLEGTDIPSAKCVVHARPTQSLVLWRQSCGRILRPWHPGCPPGCLEHPSLQPLLLDHAGNIERHGFAHEDIHWELNAKARRIDQKIRMKICKGCFAYVTQSRGLCPYCGYEFKPEDEPKEKKIAETNEQLIRRSTTPEDMKRAFFENIVKTARHLGNLPGWASRKYKDHYGAWPPWAWSEEIKSSFASDAEWQAAYERKQIEKEKRKASKDKIDEANAERDAIQEEAETVSPEEEEAPFDDWLKGEGIK